MRALAHIEEIVSVQLIEGSDFLSKVTVLGWNCVVKKSENFKVGDKVIYIEIDSIVPEKPEFEFLRNRKFRVRSIKLMKTLSQGLVLPLSILGENANTARDTSEVSSIDLYKLMSNISSIPEFLVG
jgi:hypothetical protein